MSDPTHNPAHIEPMRQALLLAARGLYSTTPNPRVGCVLINAGRIVGEGWHVRAGDAHAEAGSAIGWGSGVTPPQPPIPVDDVSE